jgi:hypothetical protein
VPGKYSFPTNAVLDYNSNQAVAKLLESPDLGGKQRIDTDKNKTKLQNLAEIAIAQQLFPAKLRQLNIFKGTDPEDPYVVGQRDPKTNQVDVFATANRDPNDILNTLIHEVAHAKSGDSLNTFRADMKSQGIVKDDKGFWNLVTKVVDQAKSLTLDSSETYNLEEVRANAVAYLGRKELAGDKFKTTDQDNDIQKLLNDNPEFSKWVSGIGGKYIDSPRASAGPEPSPGLGDLLSSIFK